MNKEKAIRILRGDVLGTNEQTHEAVFMAIKALKAEQKHGKWLKIEGCNTVQCSECFDDFDYIDGLCYLCHAQELPNYCPNCGAKMFAKDIDVPNKERSEE